MKIGVLSIVAVFFGAIFWAVGGHEIQSHASFYWHKLTGKTVTLEINGYKIEAEIARSSSERQKGLSGREELGKNKGMIFVFEKEDLYSFWMKEVNFPLDIIWIKGDTIVGLKEKVPVETGPEYTPYLPPEPVDKVLEVAGGWAEKHGVKAGQKVIFSRELSP